MKKIITTIIIIITLFLSLNFHNVNVKAEITGDTEDIIFTLKKKSDDTYYVSDNPEAAIRMFNNFNNYLKFDENRFSNIDFKINDEEVMNGHVDQWRGYEDGEIGTVGLFLYYETLEFGTVRENQITFSILEDKIYSNVGLNEIKIEMIMPVYDNTDIESLPLTTNKQLGNVSFDISGKDLIVKISYDNQLYYLNYSFKNDTDMSFFDTPEAYFINSNGQPQIIINNTDRTYLKDILMSEENETPAFVAHTVWDLNTNDIRTVDSYETYIYLKQNPKGVMMAYLYIDEYIIDKLLTIELSWVSRQKNGFPSNIFLGKYTDWERHYETLASDKYMNYKNLTSDWQDVIPLWNIIRGIYKLSKNYKMPQIDSVDFNSIQPEYNISKTEYEEYMFNLSEDFVGLSQNERYKVWALAFEQGKSWFGTKTYIHEFDYDNPDNPNNFNIIKMTYETNGKLYQAIGNEMDHKVWQDPDIDHGDDEINYTIIIFFFVAAIILISAFNSKAFRNPKAAISFIIGAIIIIGAIYFGYYILVKTDILTVILRL